MQYKVITDIREFKLLEPEWNLLFDRNTYSIFQSFVFNYYSWKEILTHSSSNSLFLVKIIRNNITIGFFPLYKDKANTFCPSLGSGLKSARWKFDGTSVVFSFRTTSQEVGLIYI